MGRLDISPLSQKDAHQIELFRRYLRKAPDDGKVTPTMLATLDTDVLAWAFPEIAKWWHPSYACAGMGV
jgi:hypothetical protein